MEKAELKERLDKIVCQIKANSKDAHFANKLVDEALSLKGQLGVEPTMVHIPVDAVEESVESDTFIMYTTKMGDAVYHTKGGYTVIADMRNNTLNMAIRQLIAMVKNAPEDDEETRKAYDSVLDASSRVLALPMVAFATPDFMFDLAALQAKYVRELYEKAMSEELQEETPEENKEFEEATMAIEALKEETPKS